MRVAEAVDNWETVLGTEIEVEGIAEISHSMSIIYESRDKKNIGELIKPGILVHGDQLEILVQRLPLTIAGLCGSEITYLVKVRILGIVANTGRSFAPLKFGHIYEIEFDDGDTGKQSLIVNYRLKNVVFKTDRSLKATEVREFRKYFLEFENMVELKRHLESGNYLVLLRRVLEADISEHICFLKRIDVEFALENSPIENGFWGIP